jgi:hypothetical protein
VYMCVLFALLADILLTPSDHANMRAWPNTLMALSLGYPGRVILARSPRESTGPSATLTNPKRKIARQGEPFSSHGGAT